MRPTLSQLNALLTDEDLPKLAVTKDSCETYGRKTCAYIWCHNLIQRRRIEAMLTEAGVTVNPRYGTVRGGDLVDRPVVEAQVSYLRAKGWNE